MIDGGPSCTGLNSGGPAKRSPDDHGTHTSAAILLCQRSFEKALQTHGAHCSYHHILIWVGGYEGQSEMVLCRKGDRTHFFRKCNLGTQERDEYSKRDVSKEPLL
jgi:hypothetical protein